MATHSQIISLRNGLRDEKTVSKRRESGRLLVTRLARPEVRKRLSVEALPVHGTQVATRVARRRALVQMLRSIVQFTCLYMEGLSKILPQDVEMFRKVLEINDDFVEGFEDSYNSEKLSRKEVKMVTSLCLGMLEDEDVLRTSEVEVLRILTLISSRKEYVVYFRPEKEIQLILEEVERRILSDEVGTRLARQQAAKMFESILSTASDLRTSLTVIMPGTIKLVATWCKQVLESSDTGTFEEQVHLTGGVAALLVSNPEQAIAPLTRHGLGILALAKRRYGSKQIPNHVLHNYFLAHLYVGEVAGKLQGRMPGDLGDLGSATMNAKIVDQLLELLLKESMTKVDPLKPTGSKSGAFKPLDDHDKTRLELVARLLLHRQRLHFADTEFRRLGDPVEGLVPRVEDTDVLDDYFRIPQSKRGAIEGSGGTEGVPSVPFVVHVLYPLFDGLRLSLLAQTSVDSQSSSFEELSKLLEGNPILRVLDRDRQRASLDEVRKGVPLVPLLQILSACAEVVPSGACWTVSGQNWQRETMSESDGLIWISSSYPEDLSTLVLTVTGILHAHGGSEGDPSVQAWSLLCLRKLAYATSVLSFLRREENPSVLEPLCRAWQSTWKVLLNPDLRYVAYTQDCSSASNGDLVALLLSAMVQHMCTDPNLRWAIPDDRKTGFLYRNQEAIWKLPLFRNPFLVKSNACFGLVSGVLSTVGLTESGVDTICQAMKPAQQAFGLCDRRIRLLDFCLRVWETVHFDGEQNLHPLAASLSFLVSGSCPVFFDPVDQCSIGQVTPDSRSLSVYDVTPFGDTIFSYHGESNVSPTSQSICVGALSLVSIRSDVAVDSRSMIERMMITRAQELTSADVVSSIQVERLLDYVRQRLCKVRMDRDSEDDNPDSLAQVSLGILSMEMVVRIARACPKPIAQTFIQSIEDSLSAAISSVNVLLKAGDKDGERLYHGILSGCVDLSRMIVDGVAAMDFSAPMSVVGAIESLKEASLNIIAAYGIGDDQVDADETVAASAFDDGFGDSDEEVCMENNRNEFIGEKRRLGSLQSRQNKRIRSSPATSATVLKAPSRRTAYTLSSLVLLLDPSYDTSEKVASALIGKAMTDINDTGESVDVRGGMYACALLCRRAVFFHRVALKRVRGGGSNTTNINSVVGLVCRILEMIGSNFLCDPVLHVFAFETCSVLVHHASSEVIDSPFTKDEARLIAELLKGSPNIVDKRNIETRPSVKAKLLQTATETFAGGMDAFLEYVGSDFPKFFVLPSLTDIDGLVRRHASIAVGAAMRVLPEQKVIESVCKRLPPISVGKSDDEARKAFKRWYAEVAKDVQCRQCWDDSFLSVEHGVVSCICEIVRNSSREENVLRKVFELLKLAAFRPELEAMCFMALDRVGESLGFNGVEGLIDAKTAGLLRLWMMSEDLSLFEIPLILSAPSTLRRILLTGVSYFIFDSNVLPSGAGGQVELQSIREAAATEFLKTNCGSVVSQLLVQTVSQSLESAVSREQRRCLLDHRLMREICSVFQDGYDDDLVRRVMKRHVCDVLAHCAALRCGDETDCRVAEDSMNLLRGILSDQIVLKQGRRYASACVRLFLVLAVDLCCSRSSTTDKQIMVESIVRGIRSLVQAYGDPAIEETSRTRFEAIGGSFVDYVLFTKYLVSTTNVAMMQRGRTFLAVLSRLTSDILAEGHDLELATSTEILSTLLLDERRGPCHPSVLAWLESVLTETLAKSRTVPFLMMELKKMTEPLFAICFHTHETLQNVLVKGCQDFHQRLRYRLLQSLGVEGNNGTKSSTWGWEENFAACQDSDESLAEALSHYKRQVNGDVIESLCRSFDVLETLLQNAEILELDMDDFACFLAVDRKAVVVQDLLGQINVKFCAQKLVRDFVDGGEYHSGSKTGAGPILNRFLAGEPWHVEVLRNALWEKVLERQLIDLERRVSSDGSCVLTGLESDDLGRLFRNLGRLCDNDFSRMVREASTRCLGSLSGYASGLSSAVAEESGRGIFAFAKKRTEPDIIKVVLAAEMSKVFAELVRCMKSDDVCVAMTALETSKVLFCGNSFPGVVEHLDEGLRRMFESFSLSTQAQKSSRILLTSKEKEDLRCEMQRLCGFETVPDVWCWDAKTWRAGASVEFSRWISFVVPSILESVRNGGEILNGMSRIALCQRISFFDAGLASSLFPVVILHLLQCEETDPSIAASVSGDTFIGQRDGAINLRISKCFASFLSEFVSKGTPESEGTQAAEHLLDVLDLLRRVTQFRFQTSTKHQKNSSPKQAKLSPEDISFSPAARWRGVPYGVVLRLDGLLVAKACQLVSRPASALLYSELYADGRFGGSATGLRLISERNIMPRGSGDISGFAAIERYKSVAHAGVTDEALDFMSILAKAHTKQGELGTAKDIESLISDLDGVDDEGHPSSSLLDERMCSFELLRQLDTASLALGDPKQANLALNRCLVDLRLPGVSRLVARGIVGECAANISAEGCTETREAWFEGSFNRILWDDGFFDLFQEAQSTSRPQTIIDRIGESSWLPSNGNHVGFYESIVNAASSLAIRDYRICRLQLRQARQVLERQVSCLVKSEIPVHSFAGVLDKLKGLNCLENLVTSPSGQYLSRDIESLGTAKAATPVLSTTSCNSTVTGFSTYMTEIGLRFRLSELIKEGQSQEIGFIDEILVDHLWCACLGAYRQGNQPHLSTQYLTRLRNHLRTSRRLSNEAVLRYKLRMLEAGILESRGDLSTSLRHLSHTIETLQRGEASGETRLLLADSMIARGKWMGKYKVEPADFIIKNNLSRGSELALSLCHEVGSKDTSELATEALLSLGRMASNLFESISHRTKASLWKKGGQLLDDRRLELQQCEALLSEQKATADRSKKSSKAQKEAISKLREYGAHQRKLSKQIDSWAREREEVEQSLERYRLLSFQSTAEALKIADADCDLSSHVYRFVSLMFTSEEDGKYETIKEATESSLNTIPSFRFATLATQLFSRVGGTFVVEKTFHEVLMSLILRLCKDHPYQCLPHLIFLSNRNRDSSADGSKSDVKADVANEITRELTGESEKLRNLLESYETLSAAYIYLAKVPAKAKGFKSEESVMFAKVCDNSSQRLDKFPTKGSSAPCVLTKPPPLRPRCDYEDGNGIKGAETIVGFDKAFRLAPGGIHEPKIVICHGSLGGRFKQLVKEDEIRQDAVMQQVFSYLNQMLMKDQRTRDPGDDEKRRTLPLRVVTYNVIPLSPMYGVLEWVEDTTSFFQCVVGNGISSTKGKASLHSRYFPGEWGYATCKAVFQRADNDLASKSRVFGEICKRHSPCFRFFFMENFGNNSSQAWFGSKQRYARSVAVSSVVGHILGIGDRHGSNILVCHGPKGGELVHIDFGIVFEQGRELNTPERVPFRLTQNVIDGLGPTGTNGMFTKACEETMAVLKHNTASLLTILSAIVSDPLYQWTVSAAKAREIQREEDEEPTIMSSNGKSRSRHAEGANKLEQNEAAMQTISRIQQKLQGYEDGTSGEQQSIESQIQLLINSARDPDNLCQMFEGWAPWV